MDVEPLHARPADLLSQSTIPHIVFGDAQQRSRHRPLLNHPEHPEPDVSIMNDPVSFG